MSHIYHDLLLLYLLPEPQFLCAHCPYIGDLYDQTSVGFDTFIVSSFSTLWSSVLEGSFG